MPFEVLEQPAMALRHWLAQPPSSAPEECPTLIRPAEREHFSQQFAQLRADRRRQGVLCYDGAGGEGAAVVDLPRGDKARALAQHVAQILSEQLGWHGCKAQAPVSARRRYTRLIEQFAEQWVPGTPFSLWLTSVAQARNWLELLALLDTKREAVLHHWPAPGTRAEAQLSYWQARLSAPVAAGDGPPCGDLSSRGAVMLRLQRRVNGHLKTDPILFALRWVVGLSTLETCPSVSGPAET